jgi:polysaccharide pyruvyl transferase WcaK-like protein
MLARSPELNDYVIPFCPKSIYDVMFLIAKSKCYIGTSLHGAITAAAYHRPTIGINSVKKLNEMIDCWLSPNIALYSECKDLPESFQKLLKSDAQKVFEHKITDIKQRIYKNFDDMFLPLHK